MSEHEDSVYTYLLFCKSPPFNFEKADHRTPEGSLPPPPPPTTKALAWCLWLLGWRASFHSCTVGVPWKRSGRQSPARLMGSLLSYKRKDPIGGERNYLHTGRQSNDKNKEALSNLTHYFHSLALAFQRWGLMVTARHRYYKKPTSPEWALHGGKSLLECVLGPKIIFGGDVGGN